VILRYRGSAGQSFGAFCVEGMRMSLEGEANDHAGKGMSGGEIVLMPRRSFPRAGGENVIAGNALLYGATGGRFFAAGRVGERFAVRNSGALAVVEGAGDHACEYMTAGVVAILGETGRNLTAGMSGGLVYVFDPNDSLQLRCNTELVAIARSLSQEDAWRLRRMLEWHRDATGSARAADLLENWEALSAHFRRVAPRPAENVITAPAAVARPVHTPPLAAAKRRRHPAAAASSGLL
jgi:glutamate synthase domain-containing protein 3